MQPPGLPNMGADQIMERVQFGRTGPDLVRQSGQAEINARAALGFGPAVQRLMLAELRKEACCQQARPIPVVWQGTVLAVG